ncbi:MAG: sodium:solute symporter family protein [Candidatus Adiutrix sp.]|nr:sodium:solute symporter family protein [Candidatus Adiutrix sp.]
MSTVSIIDWLIIAAYFIGVLGIGRWAAKKIHSDDDFLLAGRSLGKLPTALSTAATDFGGSGIIGASGLVYSVGVAGVYWNWSAAPAWFILGLTFAGPLRRLALTTIPEYLERRYSGAARKAAAILHLLGLTVSISAQTMVAGLMISTLTGMNQTLAVIISTLCFVSYTAAGGLLAVIWTDVAQYLILVFGVAIAAPVVFFMAGSFEGIAASLPETFWDFKALGWMEPLAWVALAFFMYGTHQAFIQRIFAAKDEATAKFAYVFTGVSYLVYGAIIAVAAISTAALFPGLEKADLAFPVMVRDAMPVGLKGILMAAVLAATMSTSSSNLNSAATLFSVDIYKRMLRPDASEKTMLVVARISTVVIAVISLICSFFFQRVIDIVVFSTLIYSAGVFFPVLIGLFNYRVNAQGALSALVLGGTSAVISSLFLYGRVGGLLGAIHPEFVGSLVSLTLLIVVSRLTPPPPEEKIAFLRSIDVSKEELMKKF